jgi:hypothetical protein
MLWCNASLRATAKAFTRLLALPEMRLLAANCRNDGVAMATSTARTESAAISSVRVNPCWAVFMVAQSQVSDEGLRGQPTNGRPATTSGAAM